MPPFRKQPASTTTTAATLPLDVLVLTAKAEAAQWSEVSKATRLTYERNAHTLANGWDLATAAKGTRYAMRAAGLWTMRKAMKRALKKAQQARKNGITGQELQPVREAIFAQMMKDVAKRLDVIEAFKAQPWTDKPDALLRVQQTHKQRAANDSDLAKLYQAAAGHPFAEHVLVAEFSGARGVEFAKGIRVELVRSSGRPAMRFFIESAKCDGDKKGLDVRCVESVFSDAMAADVKRRWRDLAKLVGDDKSYVVSIEGTASQTPGQRFTNAIKKLSEKAGVSVAAYSLRHRFSAQVKQASGGDAVAVALAMGHQTTETQRHYARANRGGGGVSPVVVSGVQMGQQVRGPTVRSGPRLHVRERVVLGATPRAAPTPSPRKARL